MGKALFDGQLVDAHLARPLYKHLLGNVLSSVGTYVVAEYQLWTEHFFCFRLGHPVQAADLKFIDSELYNSLRVLPTYDEETIEDL